MITEPPRGCAWRAAVTTSEGNADNHFLATEFALEQLTVVGVVTFEVEPTAEVVILHSDGGMRVRSSTLGLDVAPHELVLAHPGQLWTVSVEPGLLSVTSIDAALLRRVAESHHGAAPGPVRFSESFAATHGLREAWADCALSVARMVRAEGATSDLVVDACARLLAVATLVCFPNSALEPPSNELPVDAPRQLRQAMDFLQDNARDDVGVRELADAMHVSPRAVQYLFRKRLFVTPMEYLRGVRLHGARQDLLAADCSTATVAQIAARWRFGHTGRFAASYRQAYGQSPRASLQQR